ncbi:MAG: hypothetical protein JWR80_10050 [Bradyrhizobium sp.]|nr:hypothetical protein [Bradyrhizobium sp.]
MTWDLIETIMEGKAAAATEAEPSLIGKPYRPGSGTEGMAFDAKWCSHCARDAAWREDESNDGCHVLSLTLALPIDDPEYPKEWIFGRDGRPCCTAFTTDPAKPFRCDKTTDLFAQTNDGR